MEYKIYQDREKIASTGNLPEDYRRLFPQTVSDAVLYKNSFSNANTARAAMDFLAEKKASIIVSEDMPDQPFGDTHWLKTIGTYKNGIIGNRFLSYTLHHIARNHDGSNAILEAEPAICKANETIRPKSKEFDGYQAANVEGSTITEPGQIVECYYDEQQYSISYVLNGGTNSENNPSAIYYTETFLLESPTKEQHSFQGWYREGSFESQVTQLDKVAGHITLYAKFEEI